MADDFKSNWTKKPIVGVTAVDDERCPSGWQPLIHDSWQGTGWGCWCEDENKLAAGRCDDVLDNLLDYFRADDGCVDVKPQKPVPLSYVFGKLICV